MRRAAHRRPMQQLGTITPQDVQREWDRLRRRPAAVRRAAGWELVTGRLDDLQQIVELTHAAVTDDAREATLHRLVALARDDELAARVVLQRLVPDLIAVHRHRSHQTWARSLDVAFGDLLATGWTVIRTYNPRRRPTRLASSLVSDVEYREYRAPLRRIGHGAPIDPRSFDELVGADRVDPTVELAAIVSDPTAGLDDADRDLVRRLVSGRMTIEIARDLGVTARTVRNRRDRIAVRLRGVAVAA